jgi:hypothetical protein
MAEIPKMGLLSLANLGSHYTPPPPSEHEYYQRVGEFVVAYAQAECIIHELARKLSGLKEDKARAIFAGSRIGDLKTRILAMLRLGKRGKKIIDDVMACLHQFDVIGSQRDKLVHRYVNYESGSLKISNEMTAKSMLEYEQDLFGLNDLLCLQLDCLRLTIRLNHVANPRVRRYAARDFLINLHKPWFYKAVPPQIRKKPTRAAKEIAALLSRPQSSER